MLYDPKWEEKIEVKIEPWRQVLLDAADLIELRGWTQNRMWNEYGNVCMLGAMRLAAKVPIDQHVADMESDYYTAVMHVNANLGCTTLGWLWNDQHGRTKEQVINKLREVANAV